MENLSIKRINCPICNKHRSIYCYDCGIILKETIPLELVDNFIPENLILPINVDIILTDEKSKSSGFIIILKKFKIKVFKQQFYHQKM